MKKMRDLFLIILFVASFMMILYGAYLAFYPTKYFETEQPYKVLNKNKHVKVGENLIYEAKYCKYNEYVPLRVVRSLTDGFIYDLPISTSGNFKPGCHTVQISIPMIVPESIPTNHEYQLQISIDYKLNALRTETRTFVTEKFTLDR
jgi:hypothetical protein